MKKKLPCTHPCRDIAPVLDTAYVVLPDDRVARLLKPTLQNGKTCYNVFLDGEYTRLNIDDLKLPADELRLLIAQRRS